MDIFDSENKPYFLKRSYLNYVGDRVARNALTDEVGGALKGKHRLLAAKKTQFIRRRIKRVAKKRKRHRQYTPKQRDQHRRILYAGLNSLAHLPKRPVGRPPKYLPRPPGAQSYRPHGGSVPKGNTRGGPHGNPAPGGTATSSSTGGTATINFGGGFPGGHGGFYGGMGPPPPPGDYMSRVEALLSLLENKLNEHAWGPPAGRVGGGPGGPAPHLVPEGPEGETEEENPDELDRRLFRLRGGGPGQWPPGGYPGPGPGRYSTEPSEASFGSLGSLGDVLQPRGPRGGSPTIPKRPFSPTPTEIIMGAPVPPYGFGGGNFQDKIKDLETQLAAAKQALADLQAQSSGLSSQSNEIPLKRKIQDLEGEIIALKSDNDALTGERAQFFRDRDDAERRFEQLNNELKHLKKAKDVTAVAAEKKKVEDELLKVQRELQQKEADIAQMQGDMGTANNQLRQVTSEKDQALAREHVLNGDLQMLMGRMQQADAAKDHLQAMVNGLQQDVQGVETQRQVLERQLATMNAAFQQDHAAKSAEYARLANMLQTQSQISDTEKQQLIDAMQTIEGNNSIQLQQLNDLAGQKDALAGVLQGKLQELDASRRDLVQRDHDIAAMTAKLDSLNQAKDDLSTRVKTLLTEQDRLTQNATAEHIRQNAEMESMNAKFRDLQQETSLKQADLVKERDAMVAEIRDHKKRIDDQNSQLKVSEETSAQLKEQSEKAAKAEMDKLKQHYEAEMDKLKDEEIQRFAALNEKYMRPKSTRDVGIQPPGPPERQQVHYPYDPAEIDLKPLPLVRQQTHYGYTPHPDTMIAPEDLTLSPLPGLISPLHPTPFRVEDLSLTPLPPLISPLAPTPLTTKMGRRNPSRDYLNDARVGEYGRRPLHPTMPAMSYLDQLTELPPPISPLEQDVGLQVSLPSTPAPSPPPPPQASSWNPFDPRQRAQLNPRKKERDAVFEKYTAPPEPKMLKTRNQLREHKKQMEQRLLDLGKQEQAIHDEEVIDEDVRDEAAPPQRVNLPQSIISTGVPFNDPHVGMVAGHAQSDPSTVDLFESNVPSTEVGSGLKYKLHKPHSSGDTLKFKSTPIDYTRGEGDRVETHLLKHLHKLKPPRYLDDEVTARRHKVNPKIRDGIMHHMMHHGKDPASSLRHVLDQVHRSYDFENNDLPQDKTDHHIEDAIRRSSNPKIHNVLSKLKGLGARHPYRLDEERNVHINTPNFHLPLGTKFEKLINALSRDDGYLQQFDTILIVHLLRMLLKRLKIGREDFPNLFGLTDKLPIGFVPSPFEPSELTVLE